MNNPLKPDESALNFMRERGGVWGAYQCVALDSADLGDLRFLQVGANRTYKTAPEQYPDSHLGVGWRFRRVGFVNLSTGEIQPNAPEVATCSDPEPTRANW